MVDKAARKYLKMSGLEFVYRYTRGLMPEYDQCDSGVVQCAMLLPFVEESCVYGSKADAE